MKLRLRGNLVLIWTNLKWPRQEPSYQRISITPVINDIEANEANQNNKKKYKKKVSETG